MKFKDLIHRADFEEVIFELLVIYPECQGYIDDYKAMFNTLKIMRAITRETEYEIVVTLVESKDAEPWHKISGRAINNEDARLVSIDLVAWDEWLGFLVHNLAGLTETQFVAHCLFEMAYGGFTLEEVAVRAAALKAMMDDLLLQDSLKITNLDELFDEEEEG